MTDLFWYWISSKKKKNFKSDFKNNELHSYSGVLTDDNNFHYGLIEYPDIDNGIRGVVVASSLVDLSRNVIPVRIANISDKTKVIKEGEVLATYTPVNCINRNFQLSLSESSDTLISKLLQS
ncbi:retroviral aspartyl protease family protein [Nephila pilipes]|uniref:Retroviral aspartyl protease family protein n=1 Tax=Nephila pilipes TaxID=299642 RepID=A0A8X6IAE6_NEPPI|nr:retroviral aspartyl protease family protein [Nephila pilipes]